MHDEGLHLYQGRPLKGAHFLGQLDEHDQIYS